MPLKSGALKQKDANRKAQVCLSPPDQRIPQTPITDCGKTRFSSASLHPPRTRRLTKTSRAGPTPGSALAMHSACTMSALRLRQARRAATLPLRPGAGPLPPRGSARHGPGDPQSPGRASRRAFRRRPRERGGGQRRWVRRGPGMERGGAGGHRTEPAPHCEPRPMPPTYRQHPPSWRAREGPAPAPAGV